MPEAAPYESAAFGGVRIHYLPDGLGVSDPLALYPDSAEVDWTIYGKYLDAEGNFRTSLGAFLIEAGDRRVIVDTGIGPVKLDFPGFGTYEGGKLLDSLAETGISPTDVTDVVFTHMHVDHVGWTTQDVGGERVLTFPNARHLLSEAEWAHWHGGDDPAGPDPLAVQRPLEGRVEFVSDGDEIAPGITVLSTPGHTPGHFSLIVDGGEERVVIMGDVMYGAVQVPLPEWSVAFDMDPEAARESRRVVIHELIQADTVAAAGHFTDSVFGTFVGTGLGILWRPLNTAARS
jgi:glyoxylase-like metal-dependent hydrolase (beta-lactamase superfamily II)